MADPRHSVNFGMGGGEIFARILGGGFQRYLKDRQTRTDAQNSLNRIEQAGDMQLRNQQTLRRDDRQYTDRKESAADSKTSAEAEKNRSALRASLDAGIAGEYTESARSMDAILPVTKEGNQSLREMLGGITKALQEDVQQTEDYGYLKGEHGVNVADAWKFGVKIPEPVPTDSGTGIPGFYQYKNAKEASDLMNRYFKNMGYNINSQDIETYAVQAMGQNLSAPYFFAANPNIQPPRKVPPTSEEIIERRKHVEGLMETAVLRGEFPVQDFGMESLMDDDPEKKAMALKFYDEALAEAKEYGIPIETVIPQKRYLAARVSVDTLPYEESMALIMALGGTNLDSPVVHPMDANNMLKENGLEGNFPLELPVSGSRNRPLEGVRSPSADEDMVRYVSIGEIIEVLTGAAGARLNISYAQAALMALALITPEQPSTMESFGQRELIRGQSPRSSGLR